MDKYYAYIENNKIVGAGQGKTDNSVEISKELFELYISDFDAVKYDNGTFTDISGTGEYHAKKSREKQVAFEKEFFLTSLGYIRRNVSMSTGETKDFLSDLLPAISAGLQIGQATPIITYNLPDFTQEFSFEYMESLQEIKPATAEFVQECFQQIANDFMPALMQVNLTEVSNKV